MSDIVDIRFEFVGYDSDIKYINNCENSGCYDEGICRCGHFEDTDINGIPDDPEYIFPTKMSVWRRVGYNGKYDNYKHSYYEITESDRKYFAKIMHFIGYTLDSFYFDIESGYYGEEGGDLVHNKQGLLKSAMIDILNRPDEEDRLVYLLSKTWE